MNRLRVPVIGLALVAICTLSNSADAQLLRRIFGTKQVGASGDCPGGVCPTANAQWYNKDGLSASQHVEQVHGVSTAGMSNAEIQQHQNDYHNTYGANHPVRGAVNAVVAVPRAGVRAVARAATYPARARQSVSYGSSGSAAQSYGSSGSSVAGYGSSGSSVSGYGSSGSSVNGYGSSGSSVAGYGSSGTPYGQDYDGAPIISYGAVISQSVASGVCDCCCPDCKCNQPSESSAVQADLVKATMASGGQLGFGDRARLVRVMLAAARAAKASGASDEEIKSAMVDAGVESLAGSNQAIDIDKWLEIIQKLIPLIMKLISLFSQAAPRAELMQFDAVQYVNFLTLVVEELPFTI